MIAREQWEIAANVANLFAAVTWVVFAMKNHKRILPLERQLIETAGQVEDIVSAYGHMLGTMQTRLGFLEEEVKRQNR